MLEVYIWLYKQIVYAQHKIRLGKWDSQTSPGFWDKNNLQILARRPDLVKVNKKKKKKKRKKKMKRTYQIVDFAVFADHRVKLKESEKSCLYIDLGLRTEKLWNMKGTVIPIVIGALGTVTKALIQRLDDLEIREQVETIRTTTLTRSARILRRVLESWRDLLSLKLLWEAIS